MALPSKTRVGAYEIQALIGSGGMGEVYRARDTRLRRDVAIKMIPDSLSGDRDRLHRFEHEARAAAALNHPNILAVYDVGDFNGSPYIVSELLEGETLRDRLKGGALTTRKALEIGRALARALATAHEHGIVHRDIKPENVFLVRDDQVKVLDFGLAKLRAASSESPAAGAETATGNTIAGSIFGTAPYMAPEQIRGEAADSRSDIFSFGVLLYEMLAGRRPFRGNTSTETMAAILHADPPPLQPSAAAPTALDRIVRVCLEKRPEDRFSSAHDLALALAAIADDSGDQTAGVVVAPRVERRLARRATAVAAVMVVAAGVGAVVLFRRPPQQAPINVTVVVPPGSASADSGRLLGPPVVSPDGNAIVVSLKTGSTQELFVRRLDSNALVQLERTDGAVYPFWSPDSRQIAFFADEKLKKVPAAGGAPVTLCAAPATRGGAWSHDGTIIFGINGRGIFQCPQDGGQPIEITKLDKQAGENSHRYPVFLPDGRHFLYYARTSDLEKRAVYVESLDRNEARRRVVVADGQFAIGLDGASGERYLLSQQTGKIFAQPFDVRGGRPLGEPRPILDRAGQVSVSDTGVLVLRPDDQDVTRLVWFDRAGRELGVIGEPTDYWDLALSPDDQRVAVIKHDYLSGYFALWTTTSASQGRLEPFSDSARATSPVWAPDSRTLYFNTPLQSNGVAMAEQIVRRALSVKATEDSVGRMTKDAGHIRDISTDGRFIVADSPDQGPKSTMAWKTLDGGNWLAFPREGATGAHAQFSPDGHWVAYDSATTGAAEIYVSGFPAGTPTHRLSSSGGRQPRWRRDGKELFYLSPRAELVAVDLARGFDNPSPKPLFHVRPREGNLQGWVYDATGDGQRFLVIASKDTQRQDTIEMVLNWPGLLR